MARTGGSKKNEPLAVRAAPSPGGLMKLKPKAKTRSTWKPLDLSEPETSDASASPAPAETDASQDEADTASVASSSHILAPIRVPVGPPVGMAGSNAQGEKDEIMEVFSHKLADPIWLRSNLGKQDGELRFIQHPNRDVSAHIWSNEKFEWAQIGVYSCVRKFGEGNITTDRYLNFMGAPKRRVASLAYFTELAKGYPRFHETRPAVVIPPLSSMQPTTINQQRATPNLQPTTSRSAHYDPLATVSGLLHDTQFPALASLTLRDCPTALSRPIATRGPSTLQGLGTPADDPFATDSKVSPKTEFPSAPWPDSVSKQMLQRDPGKMDFAFRFPSGIGNSQRSEITPGAGDMDRKAFFAEQERNRAEKMRQDFAPSDRSDLGSEAQSKVTGTPLLGMAQYAPRIPSGRGPSFPGLGQTFNIGVSSALGTSMIPTAKVQSDTLNLHQDQVQQLQQPNENSRARMLEYLNRVGDEQLPALSSAQDVRGLPPAESVHKNANTAVQIIQYDKPMSSGSQVSRSALRTSDPEPGYYENRHASIYNSFGLGVPTPQNFSGPFFQDDMPTQNNPTAHRSTRMSREDELDEWWNSGLRIQRHDEFMKTLINPSISGSNKDGFQATSTDRLLVPLYETLAAYVRVPGEPRTAPDGFAPYAPPPEWAIDRSRDGNTSFFGEDWGETPRRIGRDPRFQPPFGQHKYTLFEEQQQRNEPAALFQQGIMRGGPQAGQTYNTSSPFHLRKL